MIHTVECGVKGCGWCMSVTEGGRAPIAGARGLFRRIGAVPESAVPMLFSVVVDAEHAARILRAHMFVHRRTKHPVDEETVTRRLVRHGGQ